MADQARKAYVTGEVQGVGYRAWTQSTARELGLGGWVRNLDDGRVECWLEGPGAAIDDMLTRLKTGPGAASPKEVELVTVAPEGSVGFEIRN